MEVGKFSSGMVAIERTIVCSVVEAVIVQTLLAAQGSLAFLLMVAGSLVNEVNVLPKLTGIDERFRMDELRRMKEPDAENKDASDAEDDDDDNDDDADDQEDDGDGGDEDFSGEEDDEDGDPEEGPEANGNGGSDDDDDDDEDGSNDDDGDEDDEDEDEEEEDEEDQPPAKKRK